jgi:hypothetical protein
MHSHLAEANADRSSSRDATRTATIRRLARANEIASTQIVFSTNKLSIRLFFPFVSSSLFRRIFDNRAAPDGPASAPKSDRRFTDRDVPKDVPICVSNRVSSLGHFC